MRGIAAMQQEVKKLKTLDNGANAAEVVRILQSARNRDHVPSDRPLVITVADLKSTAKLRIAEAHRAARRLVMPDPLPNWTSDAWRLLAR